MMLESVIFVMATLTGMSLLLTRHLLHPAVIYCSVWLFQLTGLLIFSERFIAINLDTYVILVLGCISFIVGTQIAALAPSRVLDRHQEVARGAGRFYLAGLIVVISLVAQVSVFRSIVGSSDFDEGLVLARVMISIDGEDIYGLSKYGNPLAIGAMICLQIAILRGHATALKRMLFFGFFLAALVMSALSTGRGPIVFVFLFLAMTYLLVAEQKKLAARIGAAFVVLIAVMFAIFWGMGSVMGKAGVDVTVAMSDLADYLFSSVPALSAYIDRSAYRPVDLEYGANTFRVVAATAAAVGLTDPPVSLVQEFIEVPHLTNLYTIYLQYLQDFGWTGVVLLPLTIGAVHGWLFTAARRNKRSDFLLFLLVVSYLPLLQVAFQETHFTSISAWIQMAFVGWVLMQSSRANDRSTS